MHKAIGLLLCLMLFATHACLAQTNQNNATHTSGKVSNLEDKIIDTVASLTEVKARANYVRTKTKGKRNLQYAIWGKPTKENPYYWVRVMEDNGTEYHDHFDFYVYPRSFAIRFYDIVNDTAITLSDWRKNYKEAASN